MGSLIMPLVLVGIILVFGGAFLVTVNKQKKNSSGKEMSKRSGNSTSTSKGTDTSTPREDVFKFMEFDKILDDMIVQENGTKFSMVVQCKGINYDLMSEVEQLAVEEGFITFLNTLRYPIQIYVQAQNIDLKKSIKLYSDRVQNLKEEYDEKNEKYSQVMNSLDSTADEIREATDDKTSVQNVYEYASDIVKYVEKLSLNKNLLQRNFYIIVSYHSSEITSVANFSKQEIIDICYNELYTRALAIISALAACSVNASVLDSNAVAELLYNSYNRDDKNYISISDALQSGYYRLYSTSVDAFQKKNEILSEKIKEDAQIKAYEAIRKAAAEGTLITPEMQEDQLREDIAKEAIEVVKGERIDNNLKEKAKKIIVSEYQDEKRKVLEEREKAKTETVEEQSQEVNKLENNNIHNADAVVENVEKNNTNPIVQEKPQTQEIKQEPFRPFIPQDIQTEEKQENVNTTRPQVSNDGKLAIEKKIEGNTNTSNTNFEEDRYKNMAIKPESYYETRKEENNVDDSENDSIV